MGAVGAPVSGRAQPGRDAVGGGAGQLRRRPDLDRLAMEPNRSLGQTFVERLEGRAALAARVAAGLVATMPAHLEGGAAVLWLTCAMGLRGFTPAEIRAALPLAGLRGRAGRKGKRDLDVDDRPRPRTAIGEPRKEFNLSLGIKP